MTVIDINSAEPDDTEIAEAMPNDVTAERYVLAAAIESRGETLGIGGIREGDFYDPRHAKLFTALHRRAIAGDPIEPAAILQDVQQIRGLHSSWLVKLLELTTVTGSVGYFAERIRDRATARAIIEAGTRAIQIGQAAEPEADMLEAANAAIATITEAATRRRPAANVAEDLDEVLVELESDVDHVATPWPDIDRLIGGWAAGRLYIVGGRPGGGKSMVGVAAAMRAAAAGERTFIASIEMSKRELYFRMLAATGRVSHDRLVRKQLQDDDWAKVVKAQAAIREWPIHVADDLTRPAEIIAEAHRIIREHGPIRFLFVDYLQLLASPAGSRVNRQEVVAEFSRQLKIAARTLNCPIMAAAQLNRRVEDRDGPPRLADLRESGAIEQDADVVMLLSRDEESTPDVLSVSVAKNRHGSTGVVDLYFRAYFQRIESISMRGDS